MLIYNIMLMLIYKMCAHAKGYFFFYPRDDYIFFEGVCVQLPYNPACSFLRLPSEFKYIIIIYAK